jgi:hypothetical protein
MEEAVRAHLPVLLLKEEGGASPELLEEKEGDRLD